MSVVIRVLNILLLISVFNLPLFLQGASLGVILAAALPGAVYFLAVNVLPSLKKYPTLRLRVLADGSELLLFFMITLVLSSPLIAASIYGFIAGTLPLAYFIAYAVVMTLGEAVIFWNGIIRVYLTSVQLGLRYRVPGVLLGMVPIADIVMLIIIYTKVRRECVTELNKHKLNESRKDERVCDTKYPVLLVHGVFFRDSRLFNYWGRIPAELEKNGARIFYGEQQSAASIEDSADELADKIRRIVKKTGCGKLNIIAHSKGGLDSRYAITKLGCAEYVASLTTINTPHRGCIFAEYLLGKAPEKLAKTIEDTYNRLFRKLGDMEPDFMAAVKDLTGTACAKFNEEVPDCEGVMYQSVGSKAVNRRSGRFPLNVSYNIVKKFDGDNDGLVALSSAPWGEKFTPLYPTGKRGITHADVIDLNREDFKGFDVREFYVQLVADLKNRGL